MACKATLKYTFNRENLLISGLPFGHTYNSSKESFTAKGMFVFEFQYLHDEIGICKQYQNLNLILLWLYMGTSGVVCVPIYFLSFSFYASFIKLFDFLK